MLIRDAELPGRGRFDVRTGCGRILALARRLMPRPGESVLEAGGGALLPGLHDHHLHLYALAASLDSVFCGPPAVRCERELARALGTVREGTGWIRAIGYHESVAGPLDRARLDRWVPDRPLRLQHRSGALWILNSAGVEALGLDRGVDAPGVERDPSGRATGRLFRLDAWLRERLPPQEHPSLARASCMLARFGVTGFTDATAGNGMETLESFEHAIVRGEIRQRVRLMGGPELDRAVPRRLELGQRKLRIDEACLPELEGLAEAIRSAHAAGRGVAIHCVTRAELVLALATLESVGPKADDRIEHASVCPPELPERIAALGLAVVTQPHFVRERGDAYLRDVEADDRAWLYRGRGFLRAGVRLAAGTDAPFGDPDPWKAMRAAVERTTESGVRLAAQEALTPEEALALFTSSPDAPGREERGVEVGAVADLCLLDRPWDRAREALSCQFVAATIVGGEPIWVRDPERLREGGGPELDPPLDPLGG